ncbi:hypothetical protein [Streptomyces sp. NPDC017260]|uniref:hypothetical protein n=1 Tax=unclassified Streptomyces TaxID=2593676 RepID=UPI0037A26F30
MSATADPIAHLDDSPMMVPDKFAREVPSMSIGPAFREHASRLVAAGQLDYDWGTIGEVADRITDYLTLLACVRGGHICYAFEIDNGMDVLPAVRFRKCGKVACITREDNDRETLCGATGYILVPEFRDHAASTYVHMYCNGCDHVYRRENDGRVAESADDRR